MTYEQQCKLAESLENLQMSCQMEGLELTDEIRLLCLSVINGTNCLQDCLRTLNAKYS